MQGKHLDFKKEVTLRISQKNKTIKDLEDKIKVCVRACVRACVDVCV
jgi:hypothetical protein